MEKEIIKDLLVAYKIEPTNEIVNTYLKLVNLGFNKTWLRNICIIKDFDKLYKTDEKIMTIYIDLSIKYHNLSIDSIRKIIRDRQLYEI